MFFPRQVGFFPNIFRYFTGLVIGQASCRKNRQQCDRGKHQEGNFQRLQAGGYIDRHDGSLLLGGQVSLFQGFVQLFVADKVDILQVVVFLELFHRYFWGLEPGC